MFSNSYLVSFYTMMKIEMVYYFKYQWEQTLQFHSEENWNTDFVVILRYWSHIHR